MTNTLVQEIAGIKRCPSDGTDTEAPSNALELETKMWELFRDTNWSHSLAYTEVETFTLEIDRIKAINQTLTQIIQQRTGAEDWREHLQYLNSILIVTSLYTAFDLKSWIYSKLLLLGSALTYKILGLYIETAVERRDYYRSKYQKFSANIGKAYDEGCLSLESLDGIERSSPRTSGHPTKATSKKEFTSIMEAFVISLHNIEKQHGIKIELLKRTCVADYYMNLFKAAVRHCSNNKNNPSLTTHELREKTLILSKQLEEILLENAKYMQNRYCYTTYQEDQLFTENIASSKFIKMLSELYDPRPYRHIQHSSKELITAAFDLDTIEIIKTNTKKWETGVNFGPTPILSPSPSRTPSLESLPHLGSNNEWVEKSLALESYTQEFNIQAQEAFSSISKIIKNNNTGRNHLIYTYFFILVSSCAYSISFNAHRWSKYIAIPSGIVGFMLGQFLDKILYKVQQRYDDLQSAKEKLGTSLQNGFSGDSRIEWFKYTPDNNTIATTERLTQMNYLVGKSWALLEAGDNIKLDNFYDSEVAVVSIRMYIAMGRAFESANSVKFLANIEQLNIISRNWADVIHRHTRKSFSILRTSSASFTTLPSISEFYDVIKKEINISEIRQKADDANKRWPSSSSILQLLKTPFQPNNTDGEKSVFTPSTEQTTNYSYTNELEEKDDLLYEEKSLNIYNLGSLRDDMKEVDYIDITIATSPRVEKHFTFDSSHDIETADANQPTINNISIGTHTANLQAERHSYSGRCIVM